ncbi:MAG: hypothetical protein V7K48_01005 [Nostoc sp.]|uniref:hypothetical protein n=1 Tax=Nostoc sp. TaxID=1180 RepID=UPI002FF5E039
MRLPWFGLLLSAQDCQLILLNIIKHGKFSEDKQRFQGENYDYRSPLHCNARYGSELLANP